MSALVNGSQRAFERRQGSHALRVLNGSVSVGAAEGDGMDIGECRMELFPTSEGDGSGKDVGRDMLKLIGPLSGCCGCCDEDG
jgi:hypothetical protein